MAPIFLCGPLFWNDRDFLVEGIHDQESRIHDQESRYIIHRLLCLACLYLLSLPQVIEEEQVGLVLLEWPVGGPGVGLPRVFL